MSVRGPVGHEQSRFWQQRADGHMRTQPGGATRHAHKRRSAARAAYLEDERRPALQRDLQREDWAIGPGYNKLVMRPVLMIRSVAKSGAGSHDIDTKCMCILWLKLNSLFCSIPMDSSACTLSLLCAYSYSMLRRQVAPAVVTLTRPRRRSTLSVIATTALSPATSPYAQSHVPAAPAVPAPAAHTAGMHWKQN